jgi:hypothetical protein
METDVIKRCATLLLVEIILPESKQPQKPEPPSQQTQELQTDTRPTLWQRFATFWFFASIVIVLLQFAYSYHPRLNIDAGILVSGTDPLATPFRIVNTGPLHVNNLRISCVIATSSTKHLEVKSSTLFSDPGGVAAGSGPIMRLDGGHSATRDCGAGSSSRFVHIPPYNPTSLHLDIIVEFDWPFIPVPDRTTSHFTVRNLADGRTVLVPDVEK